MLGNGDGEPSVLDDEDRRVVAAFTELCFRLWRHDRPGGHGPLTCHWLGTPAQKLPSDLWVCQEIVVETRPDLIVECGTCLGGSALFLAAVCELVGRGRVLSIDLEPRDDRPPHPRLDYLTGDSTSPAVARRVRERIPAAARVMVILDSDHHRAHVAAELAAYADLVTPGCYLIVEDTAVNGHPIAADFGPGPMEAVDDFLAGRADFTADRSRERFLATMSPRGYLRRVG